MGDTAMSMIDKIADCLVEDHVELMNENQRLKRENSILRSELKERLVSEWIVNYEMDEKIAEEAAEKYIIHMVAHNEGAE